MLARHDIQADLPNRAVVSSAAASSVTSLRADVTVLIMLSDRRLFDRGFGVATHVDASDVALIQVVDGALHLLRQLVHLRRLVWALPLLVPRAAADQARLVLELLVQKQQVRNLRLTATATARCPSVQLMLLRLPY